MSSLDIASSAQFLDEGKKILGTSPYFTVARDESTFKSYFGVSSVVAALMWNSIKPPHKSKPKHLLWALYFLRQYPEEHKCAHAMGCTKNTLKKWIWPIIDAIALLKEKYVSGHLYYCTYP